MAEADSSDDLTFPDTRRLTRSASIQAVLDEGDFFKGRFCHLFRGVRDDQPTRAAFIVSSKSAGKATLRNRIKRLMRESFRLLQPNLTEGWPLVFVATRTIHDELTRHDFDRDIQNGLKAAGILESTDES